MNFFLRVALTVLACAPALLPAQTEVRWNNALRQPDAWYATPAAAELTASVLRYQMPSGGWPKNTDFSRPPSGQFLANIAAGKDDATIDNKGTTVPLRFLARVITARSPEPDPALVATFLRGFDYLLDSQYSSGGWPQFYPLRKGYYTHITYNDGAMINVLDLLREAAQARPPFAFVDEARRTRAAAAVERGIACILRTQVRQNDTLTAWCAQHDETTFEPAWARNFEPPSLSGAESVGVASFLLGIENPSPEVIAAVEGAAAWFAKVRIPDLRFESFTDADGLHDRRTIPDPDGPGLWARFYELQTDRPLFLGRDKSFHYDYLQVERERRSGYVYYGTWPADFLAKDYPKWRQQNRLP
jgi:PelA/Pel-15E family pectate lyase